MTQVKETAYQALLHSTYFSPKTKYFVKKVMEYSYIKEGRLLVFEIVKEKKGR